ncbi:MAG: peptidoglycan binding domain-containing protein [Ruminococcus sp.]
MTKRKKILLIILIVFLVLLAGTYIGMAIYFEQHFYSNTVINGTDCSQMTVEEVKEKLKQQVKEYRLTIKGRGDANETVTAETLKLAYKDDGSVEQLLEKQNPWLWLVNAFQNHTYEQPLSLKMSDESIGQAVDGLAMMQEENMTAPKDASITVQDGDFVVVPEEEGTQLNRDKVIQAVKEAVTADKDTLDLEEAGCYESPSVTQDDASLKERMEKLQQMVSASLTIDFGSGRVETVDKSLLIQWITQDESGNDIFDSAKVTEYVQQLADTYDTVGKHTFTTTGGETVTLDKGDYGWEMDVATTSANLLQAIQEQKQGDFEVTYSSSAKSREENDIGDSYIEISIEEQTVWCYVDGELLVETPVVTGCVNNGTETPSGGVWKVKSRKSPYTMKGKPDENGEPSYVEEVTYWVPYSEDFTVGLHDLSSRTEYGGDIYITNGSHGCVNTPLDAMKQIYDVVSYGFPVIVY